MPPSRNIPQATVDDLDWFRLDNYAGLSQFTALDWARLVGDRLAIRRALNAGNPEAISGIFESIKATPLKWLGSDVRYIGADHPTNTASVKSLTLNRLKALTDEATPLVAPEEADAVVDELLARNPESPFQRYALLMVSIDAPKDQIVADFARWLDARLAASASLLPESDYRNGDYMEKAARSWIPHCAVPLYDLDLFELMTGKSVPSSFRWISLFPDVHLDALESKKKNSKSAAAFLFSEDTYRVLHGLAYDLTLLCQEARAESAKSARMSGYNSLTI
ncbi:hypothetical protein [Paraburkholderia sp. BR14320]|uniref:hypothetical protein n=1 Tax=unclassified Paraburkholderia TaxID=2615204 RepID=UPI0034CDEC10